ncbi:gamma-glutamyl phosphate reductase [Corynebacterium kutscheri]|uniref:Gamma-glutamyl phosphate reductase n=1 Tax=Corynebacterium kutscheri TaxID=35755 RepID=A0A0F6TCP9_9CORY|nr:glutamate-5-semialdehyde dehydrogenase [Corynebacterium kutscheri]AKE40906.1 glutamate-5-semialdehyde dehydrogenase [Corynebacterium kutscheri]VEH06695.1 gamma-glutamyl phosphate reductase [Corynebacterium kutscheri]VEH09203.1 gamma-glutamyl phosphate reductase [Corynebacterium kutscheri]VEH79288.1 gamma-glutamyl phosphate reductase [Corynebacterium kutscheri]
MSQVLAQLAAAREVAPLVARLSTEQKNALLYAAADALVADSDEIIQANQIDIRNGRIAGFNDSLLDRLALDEARIAGMAQGLRQVAGLKDPIGEITQGSIMHNGIQMRQVRVPLGVMGMVYEARPNVTIDAFGLALKSGNVAVLRGSHNARNSNEQLVAILHKVLYQHDLPVEFVQLLASDTRESVHELITARGLVDVVIPRGGAGLIETVVTHATVPTIETGTGNCHFYIDRDVSDIQQAIAMVINGKTRRPSVCNATETLLIDAALPLQQRHQVLSALDDAGVRIHGDAQELDWPQVIPAEESDWQEEYLSLDIAVKIVAGIDEALVHIRRYSTGHTEAIATGNILTAQRFADEVDAAAVMINASTAFTDGEQYGMGAEIGISTQKLHARGPMSLPELTTTKWILHGTGQVRP